MFNNILCLGVFRLRPAVIVQSSLLERVVISCALKVGDQAGEGIITWRNQRAGGLVFMKLLYKEKPWFCFGPTFHKLIEISYSTKRSVPGLNHLALGAGGLAKSNFQGDRGAVKRPWANASFVSVHKSWRDRPILANF